MSAAKKIIGFIKNKLWKEWLNGKPLSIAVLKEILDQITPDIWKGWINSSRTEIMNKLKKILIMKLRTSKFNLENEHFKLRKIQTIHFLRIFSLGIK